MEEIIGITVTHWLTWVCNSHRGQYGLSSNVRYKTALMKYLDLHVVMLHLGTVSIKYLSTAYTPYIDTYFRCCFKIWTFK